MIDHQRKLDYQRMLDCLKIYQQNKLEEQGVADTEHQIELLEKDETVTTAISEISQIDAKALPNVISQQFSKIDLSSSFDFSSNLSAHSLIICFNSSSESIDSILNERLVLSLKICLKRGTILIRLFSFANSECCCQ